MPHGTLSYSMGLTSSPRIVLIATIASAKPTCASCGVGTTSHRVHTGNVRAHVAVDADVTRRLERDAVEAHVGGARAATDAHDDLVDRDSRGTRRSLERDLELVGAVDAR